MKTTREIIQEILSKAYPLKEDNCLAEGVSLWVYVPEVLDELETYINKVREENTKEIQRRVLDLIFDTRNSQEYVRGFMSCKTYIDGLLFQYLQSIKEQEK